MSNTITVGKEFFGHLLDCMEEQKGNCPNSQGRYVGVREPIQEKIDAAYHKARALLSQDSQGNSSEDVQRVNALYQVLNQLLGQKFEYTSKDTNTSQAKDFSYQESPIAGHTYTLTWDPAKSPDFSVITIIDRDTGRVAVFDYDNPSDYRSQTIRVLSLASRYNKASIVIDPTGIGSPLVEDIRASGVAVLEKVL